MRRTVEFQLHSAIGRQVVVYCSCGFYDGGKKIHKFRDMEIFSKLTQSLKIKCPKMSTFFKKKFGGHMSIFDVTNTPVSYFCWHLLCFKAKMCSLLCTLAEVYIIIFLEIHLWCDAFATVYGQHSI